MRVDTALTRLIGMDLPIVQAGMSWVSSNAELPLAVSNAGGLGVIAAGPMRLPDLNECLTQIRTGTDRPWAVNMPLYRKGADEAIVDLIEHAPPVIIASQGGPKKHLGAFHQVGTKWLHVVTSLKHAAKAAESGVDGLVVVGAEAGGHPPEHGVTTLVLTRLIAREFPDVPVVAAGGFADGKGLAAALSLGAAGAQFGTRFIATNEATVHESYQQRVLDAAAEDAVLVGRGLSPIRALRNEFTDTMHNLERQGADEDDRREVFSSTVLRQAAKDGEVGTGKVEAGQSSGLVSAVRPAAEVVRQIAAEYGATVAGLPRLTDGVVRETVGVVASA
ncbi:NAD(P)H-dependent flavin oxidoreductase [Brevibacterium aurantiacum]|uniref:NAD(P)H-dependent flavin oxidoreductase n=1 Tax=Brevibacterium aurantiacum TaxID=273384 RepID=UPI0000510145|nr:nitronate monooxygenase family protein [Brevibacterium aurantiacum]